MTIPNIVNPNYPATAAAYRAAKVDRSGALRGEAFNVSIPSGQTVGTIIGLVPFQTGAKFDYGSSIFVNALGASVTASLGYVYDDNVTFTNAPAGFLAATAANTANLKLTPNVEAGTAWKAIDSMVGTGALANGWIVLVIGGATTGTTGTVYGEINLMYDQP